MKLPAIVMALLACGMVFASPAGRVDQYLADISTWSADFEQRIEGAQGTPARNATGHLYLQKPGKFRWDYAAPNEQMVLADGRKLWFFDKDLGQVNVRDLDSSLAGSPAMLLASQRAVSDEFEITDLPPSGGLEWFQLKPKHGTGDFMAARIGFLKGELVRMLLADKLNQLTDIKFSHAVRNQPIAASVFSFTPPPGVDVIGGEAPAK